MAADFKFLFDVKTGRAPADIPNVDNPSIDREASCRAVVESLFMKVFMKVFRKEREVVFWQV